MLATIENRCREPDRVYGARDRVYADTTPCKTWRSLEIVAAHRITIVNAPTYFHTLLDGKALNLAAYGRAEAWNRQHAQEIGSFLTLLIRLLVRWE
jgi:hypothetical protein